MATRDDTVSGHWRMSLRHLFDRYRDVEIEPVCSPLSHSDRSMNDQVIEFDTNRIDTLSLAAGPVRNVSAEPVR